MNIKKIIFMVFIMFLFIISCKAETYQCEYDFDGQYTYTLEYDNENSTVNNLNEKENISGSSGTFTFEYKYIFYENELKLYKKGECPILYLKVELDCKDSGGDRGNCKYIYTFYSDAFIREDSGIEECVINRDNACLELYFGKSITYYTGVIKENSEVNEGNTNVSKCYGYSIIEKEIRKQYEQYNTCTSNTCTSYLLIANKNIDKAKQLCNSIFEYRDMYIKVEENKYIQDECINICLHIEENIDNLKKEYGIIDSNVDISQCGFSGKLISWIANIVKWGKYLVPVVVIVMGIIDFIQAIAADKDDGMKKAQGRFIKRLIAAALIFILPFIIEFVLNKMGFDANGCGIIDL